MTHQFSIWCVNSVSAYSIWATELVNGSWDKLSHAQSLSVTLVRDSEEFPRTSRVRFWFRKGGFFRADNGATIDVSDSKVGWTYRSDKKIYQRRPALSSTFDPLPMLGLAILNSGWKLIGDPMAVEWHKMKCLRVEMDGTKMTKETKLYLFFDPQMRLPLGISTNLGSMTQLLFFKDLAIDPKIPDSMFQFTPQADWKEVDAKSGG